LLPVALSLYLSQILAFGSDGVPTPVDEVPSCWHTTFGAVRARDQRRAEMAVRVRLSDGVRFVINANSEEFAKAYQEALKKNELLEVENGDGKKRMLNPQQILYFENVDGIGPEDDDDPLVTAQAEDQPVHH
jgi:hypothetical protein